jgi:hypothetical protein
MYVRGADNVFKRVLVQAAMSADERLQSILNGLEMVPSDGIKRRTFNSSSILPPA